MAKWKCLFGWVKKLFTPQQKEKKPKKLGWCLGRLKLKQHPTITATNTTLIIEAKTKQRKHVLAMAVATKAAAEAAVAAAHAAAEVVRLTAASRSYSYKEDQILAAIKIQSAYRAHLARKALRALKGVVRLQAIVRGEAARRQVSSNSKKSPWKARNQAEIIQEGSTHSKGDSCKSDKTKQLIKQKKLDDEMTECSSQRTWDCSLHSREDVETIWLRKQEAIAKRERMKQYSSSHRDITIRQMVEETVAKETCDVDLHPKSSLNLFTKELQGTTQFVAQRNLMKIEDLQGQESSLQMTPPRKSFSHVKRSCVIDDNSMPNSPGYMALTESSKAKARSLSTPRERTRLLDFCYNQNVPQKEGTSFWSSYYDATSNTNGNSSFYYN